MNKYQYEMTLQEASKAEADLKMSSLSILASRLKANELAKLAHIVKNDPVKTTLAKKYLGL